MCTVSVLKNIVAFFSFIIMSIGIAVLVVGAIAVDDDRQNSDLSTASNWKWYKAISGIMLALGIFATLLGLLGLVAALKKHSVSLAIFDTFLLPLGLFFLAIAIAGAALSTKYYHNMRDQQNDAPLICNSQNLTTDGPSYDDCHTKYCGQGISILEKWLPLMDLNVQTAASQYGKNSDCIALVTNDALYQSGQLSVNPKSPITFYTNNPNNTKAFVNIQGCKVQTLVTKYDSLMSFLEDKLQCSGVCSTLPYYLYSNVNRTPLSADPLKSKIPNGACYYELTNWIKKYGVRVYASCFVIAGLLLIDFVLVIVLTCKNRAEKKNTYERKELPYKE